jgi:peptide/nickel transport system substrate-binding protein
MKPTKQAQSSQLESEYQAGKLTRREFIRLASLLGVSMAGIGAFLASCATPATPPPAPTAAPVAASPVAAATAVPATQPAATTAPVAQPTAQPAATGGTLTIAAGQEMDSLDPANNTTGPAEHGLINMFDRLTEYDADLNLQPSLAEKWESSADRKVWTFYLRKGVKFHDGTDLNAEAVKFTFDRLLNEKSPVKKRGFFLAIKGVRVVDPYTVEFTTKDPFGPLPGLMATSAASIVSPKAVQEAGDQFGRKQPVGSGPFVFVEWSAANQFVMKRNDTYWGGPPSLDRVIFKFTTEPGTRVAMLETGQADIAESLPPSEMARLSTNKQIEVITKASIRGRDIRINVLDEKFKDVRVRQAMNYAVNMPEIIKTILGGQATYTGGPFPPTVFGAIPGTKYKYDPAMAKKLLADAGFPNGFKTTLLTTTGTAAGIEEMHQAVQAQLLAVGIDAKITQLENAGYQPIATAGLADWQRVGKALVAIGTSARYPDPDSLVFDSYHSSQFSPLGTNRGFYKNEKVDALIEQGEQESDPAKRAKIYADMQQILIEDPPAIFLCAINLVYGIRTNVKGMNLMPTQQLFLGKTRKE